MATTLTKDANGNYVVKPGDNLTRIANSQGRSLSDLLADNPQFASNPNLIQPGQVVYNRGATVAGTAAVPSIVPQPNNGMNLTPTPGSTPTPGPMNFQDLTKQILQDYQQGAANQFTGNKAALFKGKENMQATNAKVYSQDLLNANLSNESRLQLLNSDTGLQEAGFRSIEAQQGMNEAHYKTSSDILRTVQEGIDKEAERAFEREKLKKEAEIAMYKAANPTGNGNQITDNERALLTTFISNPIVKEYNTIIGQKNYFDKLVNNGVSGPADLATIFTFMKGLDPTSVVRETEYDNAAKSGNIFQGWAAKFNGYFNEKGGILPANVKQEFQALVNQHLESQKIAYDNFANEMRTIAERQGLNPDNVVINFSGGVGGSTPSGTGETKTINGTKYEKVNGGWQKVSGFNSVGNTSGSTRADRNNNPLNIKVSGTTLKYPGVAGIDTKPAADGGNFVVFADPQAGINAAARLIKTAGYINLPVDAAMKRWSGGGYGDDVAPQFRGRTIASLSDAEIQTLLKLMAKREGYSGNFS